MQEKSEIKTEKRGAAIGALAVGAIAFGAAAVGALVVGVVTVRRLGILDARIEKLSIGTLTVDHLHLPSTFRSWD
jgi:hypothetical protein